MRSWRSSACRRRLCRTPPLPTLPRLSSPICRTALAYAAFGRRLGPVLEFFFLVAMLPVLSAFDVFVFACLLPRFQLWLVIMLRLPGFRPCGLLRFRGRGCCKGQRPISACRCGCVRCIAHSSRSSWFLFACMKTWIFQERQESQVSQVQVVPQHVQLPMREVFPECWERNRVDLARISAKIGFPHSILCNIAFERNLEDMSVDEVRVAARSLVASEPVGEERITQAAAAPSSDLRTRSGLLLKRILCLTCGIALLRRVESLWTNSCSFSLL